MPELNELQKAFLKNIFISKDGIIDPDTGSPVDWDSLGGTDSAAIQALIDASISALVASAPGALNTLDELAAALGDDANYAATITTALAGKQPLDSDLTAIAALSTTSYGRSVLAVADAIALQKLANLYPGGGLPPIQMARNVGVVSSLPCVFSVQPLQTSIFFAQVAAVASATTVSSITQTNVTWTQLRTYDGGNASGSRVALWKGIPTGTPGLTATVGYGGSTNAAATVTEWPAAAGLTGTVDQALDGGGTTTTQLQITGPLTPDAAALTFVMFAINNGSVPMQLLSPLVPPYYKGFVQVHGLSFFCFGYLWGGPTSLGASATQTNASAATANMLISVL